MGMHTAQIRDKCLKCKPHHIQKLIPGSDFHVDFCTLADMECSEIKHCDVKGKVWVRTSGFIHEPKEDENVT